MRDFDTPHTNYYFLDTLRQSVGGLSEGFGAKTWPVVRTKREFVFPSSRFTKPSDTFEPDLSEGFGAIAWEVPYQKRPSDKKLTLRLLL